jgi:hypothetical protein
MVLGVKLIWWRDPVTASVGVVFALAIHWLGRGLLARGAMPGAVQ